MGKVLHFLVIAFVISLTATFTNIANAQRNCQTMDNLQVMQLFDPEIPGRMQAIERHTSNYLPITELRSEQKIIIPVVVHIVYAHQGENLSMDLIRSQIAVLNEDYNRLNADRDEQWAQAASVNIEFRLAELDPNGNPTNGVVRKFTQKSRFTSRNAIKFDAEGGSDAWPASDYLNIWVGDLSGRQMGFAQFPGAGPTSTDGVVIDYAYFGRRSDKVNYGLGRTTTHEVGHWLNLRHIWGDGDCSRDDYVADTPTASLPTYGCQHNKNTCAGGERDMVENFMDYTNDPCMNLFTQGQKARMRALFMPGGFRASILESRGLKQNTNATASQGGSVEETTTPESAPEEENTTPPEEPGLEPNASPCPAPYNLSAFISGNGFIASWAGNSEKYIFQIQLPNVNQWFGFTTPRQELRIVGLRSETQYLARVKSVCADDTESDWQYFTLSLDRFTTGGEWMKVMPNPAHNYTMVNWEQADLQLRANQIQEVKPIVAVGLYNMMGQRVLNQRVDPAVRMKRLALSNLEPGMYIVILQDAEGQIVQQKKIIVH